MFIEPGRKKADDQQTGWIEVIAGSMFSGKTEELIRRLNRARIANLNVEIYKPALDVRYDVDNIVSHNKTMIRSTPVNTSDEILLLSGNCDVVGIDEAQFFDEKLVDIANTLAYNGKRVILAGLDMDSNGKPFGPMPNLMAIAEFVTKVHAICVKCGNVANYSYRKSNSESQVLLGEHDLYEARCRTCFKEGIEKGH